MLYCQDKQKENIDKLLKHIEINYKTRGKIRLWGSGLVFKYHLINN